jgi:hypothetical protein
MANTVSSFGPTDPATIALRDKQWHEAKGAQPRVTCGCGLRAPIRFLFKCLYCECFFCDKCAEVHFGETRAEYRRRNG